LARLYGLTRSEAAVAVLLLHGKSPADAAAELTITMNTVRTHIQHIFQKAAVDRLSEFVRLVLRGPIAGIF
jgi:DNA-binding CsgD family transcriptional regulator